MSVVDLIGLNPACNCDKYCSVLSLILCNAIRLRIVLNVERRTMDLKFEGDPWGLFGFGNRIRVPALMSSCVF